MRSRREGRKDLFAERSSDRHDSRCPRRFPSCFFRGMKSPLPAPSAEHLVTAYDLGGKRGPRVRRPRRDRRSRRRQHAGEFRAPRGRRNGKQLFLHLTICPSRPCASSTTWAIWPWRFRSRPWNFSPRRRPLARPSRARKTGKTASPPCTALSAPLAWIPKSQEVWIAIGTLLMQFDKDGQRLSSFRTFLPDGARLEASHNSGGARPAADRCRPAGNLRISKAGKTPAMNFTCS